MKQICKKCLKEKVLEDFVKDKTKKNGRYTRCKLCCSQRAAELRDEQRSKTGKSLVNATVPGLLPMTIPQALKVLNNLTNSQLTGSTKILSLVTLEEAREIYMIELEELKFSKPMHMKYSFTAYKPILARNIQVDFCGVPMPSDLEPEKMIFDYNQRNFAYQERCNLLKGIQ